MAKSAAVKSSSRPRANKQQDTKKAKRDEFVRQHAGMRLLGEIITWNLGAQLHKHVDVQQALKDAGLDSTVAKAIMPKHAFNRAMKKLTDDRVIDPLAKNGEEISFQFTKRFMENDEWSYAKETVLVLNTTTGVVTCQDADLQKFAQEELDRAIENRTTADITKMIQTLFESQADLFPIRDQGGVYFVLDQYSPFVDKIDSFVTKLCGKRLNRFPIPAGTETGDRSVQDAILNGLSMVVADHEDAVENFGITTRDDTIERQAAKIKETRVKVEAYANYLQDKADEMLALVDEANRKLLEKVAQITQDKANAPQVAPGANRTALFGHSVTAVIRWMGKEGWNFADAKRVLEGMDGIVVSDATIRAQLGGWRDRGEPAKLSDDQIQQLKDAKGKKEEKPKK